jgi:hypothetical protein
VIQLIDQLERRIVGLIDWLMVYDVQIPEGFEENGTFGDSKTACSLNGKVRRTTSSCVTSASGDSNGMLRWNYLCKLIGRRLDRKPQREEGKKIEQV